MEKKCSLIVLCGYLGAGKTTLIRYILKTQNLYKVAVIQNEFADEMGIEAPLIQDSKGSVFDKFYELPNGCICCSAKNDLLRAIEYFLENENFQLDYILIETNGLADPSSTIKTFWTDDELKFPAVLKTIVSVIPAHKLASLKDEEIFLKQAIFADIILLNQTDKINENELDSLEKELIKINPLAKCIKTKYCEIDLKIIFESEGFLQTKTKPDLLLTLENFTNNHCHSKMDCVTINFEKNIEFDVNKLEKAIGYLLWEKPENSIVLRIKAIITIAKDECIYALQAVDDVFEIKRTEITWGMLGIERYSRFLFVGQNLNSNNLSKILI